MFHWMRVFIRAWWRDYRYYRRDVYLSDERFTELLKKEPYDG